MRALIGILIFSFAQIAIAAGAESIVVKLYHDYAWEAVIQEPANASVGLMQEPHTILERYFETSLVDLILQDRECVEHTHEICQLDFLPIWGGQDPAATELSITPASDPSLVHVKFLYPGNQEKIELTYKLTKGVKGWRISNILGPNWNLRHILGNRK